MSRKSKAEYIGEKRRQAPPELLLDPHADRQADAMDGNHTDVEQGTLRGASRRLPRPRRRPEAP